MTKRALLTLVVCLSSVCAQAVADEPAERARHWRSIRHAGPNCLYLMMRSRGIDADYSRILAHAEAEPGRNCHSLQKLAANLGFDLQLYRARPDTLRELDLPVILHVEHYAGDLDKGGSYYLLRSLDDKNATLVHGAFGYDRLMPLTMLRQRWSGYLLAPPDTRRSTWVLIAIAACLGGIVFAAIRLRVRALQGPSRIASPKRGVTLAATKCGAVFVVALCGFGLNSGAQSPDAERPLDRTALIARARAWLRAMPPLQMNTRTVSRRDPNTSITNQLTVVDEKHMRLARGHGTRHMNWRDDGFSTTTYLQPDRFVREWPHDLAFEAMPAHKDFPIELATEPLFALLGWWPERCPARAPRPWGSKSALLDILGDSRRWAVGAKLVRHRGTLCHILERPNVQRIYLDANRGMLIVRRERLSPGSAAASVVFEARGTREIASGVWLPSRWDGWQAQAGQAPDTSNPPDMTIHVESLEIDPDRSATFVAKPGSVLMIRDSEDWKQVVPGGLDYLVRQGDALLAERSGSSTPSRPLVWMIAICLLTLGIAEVWMRRRLKPSSSNRIREGTTA